MSRTSGHVPKSIDPGLRVWFPVTRHWLFVQVQSVLGGIYGSPRRTEIWSWPATLCWLLVLGALPTWAAEQTLPTRVFLVRNPVPNGDATKRKVVYAQEVRQSSITIMGDPTANGATLRVSLVDGGEQCFDLPAAAWSALGTLGFKYRNLNGPGAAIDAVIKKEQFSHDFILKWKLRGTQGPINIVPEPGNPGFALNFHISGGDEYCAGGSTPAGSVTTTKVYNVRNAPAPTICGAPACSPSGAFLDASETF